jgi:hypothetical protein
MATLQEYISNLPKKEQFKLAVKLVKLTLPVWEDYSQQNELTYRDTVVGLQHQVDKRLLQNTVQAVDEYTSLNDPEKLIDAKRTLSHWRAQFNDPIAALQDSDWELPGPVDTAFYAVYNLIESVIGKEKNGFGDSTISISILQAADALESSKMMTFDQIREVIYG